MLLAERLRLKIRKFWSRIFADIRKKQLNNTSFTIISNNCWGGMIYESYNLPKQSPTVGLFIMAEDYIRLISNLKGYFSESLTFIYPEESKWKDVPDVSGNKHFGSYPIGKLKDVEIFFLHYHSEQEAKEKWERRVARINWEKLLIKFNDQNGCQEKHIQQFLNLPYPNKIFFTCKRRKPNEKNVIVIPQLLNKKHIMASYEPFGQNRRCDITTLINSL